MWPKFNFMSYSMQAVGSLVPVPALGFHLRASEFIPVVGQLHTWHPCLHKKWYLLCLLTP